ncbi:zinc ribbon domain-containing protein [Mariniphaga sp.]|uniref:zinc ribbon domain-containing protein n=1 Tax=Mariniphaga sp. TaxID=1954475 RepID=UPI00356456A9
MPFCANCGKEIPPGARFCGNCGTELNTGSGSCAKCGKTLEQNEKFCSACGTPVKTEPPKPPSQPKPEEPKLTKEGRKIISGGPKPDHDKKAPAPLPLKKKEKRKGGCFFRTLLILLSIVLVSALLIFVVNVFFVENDETPATIAEKTEKEDNDGLTGTNIPGIVDIEPGDVSHLPENRDKTTEQILPASFHEEKALKTTTTLVEKAFASADTTQLKNLLTPQSLKKYSGKFSAIQPEMAKYAKALTSKKLILKTDIYALYSIEDKDGNKFSTEFAQVESGVWKLVRF